MGLPEPLAGLPVDAKRLLGLPDGLVEVALGEADAGAERLRSLTSAVRSYFR